MIHTTFRKQHRLNILKQLFMVDINFYWLAPSLLHHQAIIVKVICSLMASIGEQKFENIPCRRKLI